MSEHLSRHDHASHASHHHHDHHDHSHGHGHHHHGFTGHAHGANERRIAFAACLTGLFMIAEVAGGLVSGSLALLADAGHMLTDFAALGLGWFGFRLARKPGDKLRTFGYDRFQVLVAFVNGLALFLIAGFILYEAVERLQNPSTVLAGTMLWIAIAGLVVNIAVFAILHGADRENLNIRGALLHVLGDLLGSVAAIVAAIVILYTGWFPIDPILSVLVSAIILLSAYRLVRDAGHVLLEGAPGDIAVGEIGPHLVEAVDGLNGVHHVHAWSITPERKMATLHASIDEAADGIAVTRAIKAELSRHFDIGHATVEVEFGICADEGIENQCGGHGAQDDVGSAASRHPLAGGHAHAQSDHSHPRQSHGPLRHARQAIASAVLARASMTERPA